MVAADDAYAVGDVVLHYDGRRWSSILSTKTHDILHAVSASATGVVAVGAIGIGSAPHVATIYRYDKKSWSIEHLGQLSPLCGVSVGGATVEPVAVGDYGIIARRTSTGWLPLQPRGPYGSSIEARAVWGSGANDVYVLGYGQILHFDGTRWSPVAAGASPPKLWMGIWGSATDDVYVVGGEQVLHFDGARWRSTTIRGAGLRGVWGRGRNDVFVAGGGYDGAIYHRGARGSWEG